MLGMRESMVPPLGRIALQGKHKLLVLDNFKYITVEC